MQRDLENDWKLESQRKALQALQPQKEGSMAADTCVRAVSVGGEREFQGRWIHAGRLSLDFA